MRADFPRDRAAGAYRDTENNEISAFHGRDIGFNHLIGKAQLGNAAARGRRLSRGNDRFCGALRACVHAALGDHDAVTWGLRYQLDNGHLVPLDPIPSASAQAPLSRE